MRVTEPDISLPYAALYQATIREAVAGSAELMARLVAHVRAALRARQEIAVDLGEFTERDRLTDSRRRLNQCEPVLCQRFAEELQVAFSQMASFERPLSAPNPRLQLDQLVAMDDAQLEQSVASARVSRAIEIAAHTELAELNRLICTMLGCAVVQLERNPLRPDVYAQALSASLSHLPLPTTLRKLWMTLMTAALGQELSGYYGHLCAQLRLRGVGSGAVADGAQPPCDASPARSSGQPRLSLTLEGLRALLADTSFDTHDANTQSYSHDAAMPGNGSSFHSEAGPTAFRATAPAAFEAVRDMKQLDRLAQQIEGRRAASVVAGDVPQPLRESLRRSAQGLDQTLGIEVVILMIDNITNDERLLAPVRQLVGQLEPALLQLALVDPRFFSQRQHPARRLLHEITHRSIAFESVDSRGFSGFMEPLRDAVAPLAIAGVDTAEPFHQVLGQLQELWDDPGAKEKRQLEKAIKALKKAEQRKVLATIITADVRSRVDASLVPNAVLSFLCGPWAHVIAHARMVDKSEVADPGHFAQLIDDLMWSAQPQLTCKQVSTLTLLAPQLLNRLREGLATIDYPPHKTSEFFEVLINLHQRGLKADAEIAPPAQVRVPLTEADASTAGEANNGFWIAPLEARASGFIDMGAEDQPVPPRDVLNELVVGSWVALMAEGSWTRTCLSWTSHDATLLLFTDALGYMQSLTRKSCEKLFVTEQLRIISLHPVEDALDAVVEAAMRNSVDIRV